MDRQPDSACGKSPQPEQRIQHGSRGQVGDVLHDVSLSDTVDLHSRRGPARAEQKPPDGIAARSAKTRSLEVGRRNVALAHRRWQKGQELLESLPQDSGRSSCRGISPEHLVDDLTQEMRNMTWRLCVVIAAVLVSFGHSLAGPHIRSNRPIPGCSSRTRGEMARRCDGPVADDYQIVKSEPMKPCEEVASNTSRINGRFRGLDELRHRIPLSRGEGTRCPTIRRDDHRAMG